LLERSQGKTTFEGSPHRLIKEGEGETSAKEAKKKRGKGELRDIEEAEKKIDEWLLY